MSYFEDFKDISFCIADVDVETFVSRRLVSI